MKDLVKSIFTILKYGGKTLTVLRNIILNTLFIALVVLVLLSLFGPEEREEEPQGSLLLAIEGDIVEEKQMIDPLSEVFNEAIGFSRLPEETLLQDILDAIYAAADDENINALVFDLSRMGTGSLNQILAIGEALEYFKLSGKPVIAAEDYYTQNKYLLACFADSIFLNPIGLVDLHGLAAYRLYFRDALDKLKVNYHIFRVGTHKAAVEPILRNSMSEEAKAQNRSLMTSLWQEVEKKILTQRNIDAQTLEQYTNSVATLLQQTGGDAAQLALQINLVDELKSRHQLRSYLAELSGAATPQGFRHVTFRDYLKTIERSYLSSNGDADRVAIIVARGNIVTGDAPSGTIGSEKLARLLRQAREDSRIRALVLRINSGGGSVFASEVIRQELLEFKRSGKPYVVSMAGVAASGAYWISADADQIWAHPTTITGSIGIFGAIPTFENTLAHLGIYSDGTATAELATGFNLTRPLSPELKEAIQLGVEHGYDTFLTIVSSGRNIERNRLESYAQGRVFTGRRAKELGLVDELGSLDDAVAAAASLAGLSRYQAEYLSKPLSLPQRLLRQLKVKRAEILPQALVSQPFTENLNFFDEAVTDIFLYGDPRGIYAHYRYCLQ